MYAAEMPYRPESYRSSKAWSETIRSALAGL